MAVSATDLFAPMLEAMKTSFGKQWPKVKDFAEGETRKLAQTLAEITRLRLAGKISESECAVLLEMQKNTARAVLLAVKGMGLLMVEQAINAAITAVNGVINKAIGFPFLGA